MTQLRLVWPENNYDGIMDFDFYTKFKLSRQDIFIGKLEPSDAIYDNGRPLEIVFFRSLGGFQGTITFLSPNEIYKEFKIPENIDILKLTIIEPVPQNAPSSWNAYLTNDDSDCYANLFYYPQEGDRSLRFLKSIKCSWSSIPEKVKDVLTEAGLGLYGKSIGVLNEDGSIPELKALAKFFERGTDSFRKGKVFSVFVVSSFTETNRNDDRNFSAPGKFGEFGSGRGSSKNDISPVKIRPKHASSSTNLRSKSLGFSSTTPESRAGKRTFTIIKDSWMELEIVTELSSMFPYSFPTIYDISTNPEETEITYVFEELEPLMDEGNVISHLLVRRNAEDSLFYCFCFALHTLYALDLLHSKLNLVHSDISPRNIMFSEVSETWKLTDFDQTWVIDDSVREVRVAGTPGYISPESKESGVFNEKSDIFSLGKVFVDVIDSVILHQIHALESDDEDRETVSRIRSIEPVAFKFTNVMLKMTSSDPNTRPTAFTALKSVFELFKSVYVVPDTPIFNLICSCINRRHVGDIIAKTKKSEEHVSEPVDSPRKHPKI